MTSKFGGLAANVTAPSRMTIVHPATGEPIYDTDGKPAYIDLLSQDSAPGRAIAKKQSAAQLKRAVKAGNIDVDTDADPVDDQIDILAALTRGWYLVDPSTGGPIDYAFDGVASARELFAADELHWLRRQAYVWVINQGNFMPPSRKN